MELLNYTINNNILVFRAQEMDFSELKLIFDSVNDFLAQFF